MFLERGEGVVRRQVKQGQFREYINYLGLH